MDSEKLNNWMQVVGIFALVASLIFVGLEMRQSQTIAVAAAYQARADSSMTLRLAILESEKLQSAMVKVNFQGKTLDQLTPDERIVVLGRWGAQMVYTENMHFQYLHGLVTEEQWLTNRAGLTLQLNRSPEWRRNMLNKCARNLFRESFCVEMKAAAERTKAIEN